MNHWTLQYSPCHASKRFLYHVVFMRLIEKYGREIAIACRHKNRCNNKQIRRQ